MVVEIHYDAKCKHCENLCRFSQGKKVKHKCKITEQSITLKDKACKDFKLG